MVFRAEVTRWTLAFLNSVVRMVAAIRNKALAAMMQVLLGRDHAGQFLAFNRQRVSGGVKFGGLEAFRDVLQQADLVAGEQRKQIFKTVEKIQ